MWRVQVLVDSEDPGFGCKGPGSSRKSPWISHPVNSGNFVNQKDSSSRKTLESWHTTIRKNVVNIARPLPGQ